MRRAWIYCHRVYVRYIIHLYCLAVQAGFYSDVLDFRSKCPRFDPRPGHGDFSRVRDNDRFKALLVFGALDPIFKVIVLYVGYL